MTEKLTEWFRDGNIRDEREEKTRREPKHTYILAAAELVYNEIVTSNKTVYPWSPWTCFGVRFIFLSD